MEPAHGLDDVVVQEDARRKEVRGAVHVDDPAAHCEVPGIGRRGEAGVPEGDELRGERPDVDPVARPDRLHRVEEDLGRNGLLDRGVGGGHHDDGRPARIR
jgi:hypothetical protein